MHEWMSFLGAGELQDQRLIMCTYSENIKKYYFRLTPWIEWEKK